MAFEALWVRWRRGPARKIGGYAKRCMRAVWSSFMLWPRWLTLQGQTHQFVVVSLWPLMLHVARHYDGKLTGIRLSLFGCGRWLRFDRAPRRIPTRRKVRSYP